MLGLILIAIFATGIAPIIALRVMQDFLEKCLQNLRFCGRIVLEYTPAFWRMVW